jgi:hypothetical protein
MIASKIKDSRFSVFTRGFLSLISSPLRFRNLPKSPDLVFIWIPKAAGTSIYTFLKNQIGCQKLKKQKEFLAFPNYGPVTFGHVSYNDLRALGTVSEKFHNSAFKFCFVRCPYARAVSLFNYLKMQNRISKNLQFDGFLDLVHCKRPSIGLYNSLGISQANPQTDWLFGEDNKLIVDHIFKVEDMLQFKLEFETRFGVSFDMDTNLNQSVGEFNLNDVYESKALMEKIELIYARDFEVLGYLKTSCQINTQI